METLKYNTDSDNLNITITKTDNVDIMKVDNSITTALEGGSNYWYAINDLDIIKLNSWIDTTGKRNKEVHYKFLDAIYQDVNNKLPIYDLEEVESLEYQDDYDGDMNTIFSQLDPLGYISIENIIKGLKSLITDNEEIYNQDFGEQYNGDCISADVVLQHIVMNKVVFG